MKNKNLYFFVGTMAEYIKLSPIIKRLNDEDIDYKIIQSGQTGSSLRFDELRDYTGDVVAHISLKPKSKESSVMLFLLWALRTLFSGYFQFNKDLKNKDKKNTYVIVHGDTVSSLIGALISKISGVKIVHVESGLRSFNFFEPFPEEICRYIIIHIADIMFAPTDWAFDNIQKMPGKKINTKYNTLLEPCLWALSRRSKSKILKDKKIKKYYILTMHRQEHILFQKEWTKKTIDFIFKNSNRDLTGIFTMHHLTKEFLKNNHVDESDKKVELAPRVPFPDFMKLMYNAEYIATDGCTNQEEAYYMGLPLLALRHRTERIEGLDENVVIYKGDKKKAKKFLKNYKVYRHKKLNPKVSPSKIIVDYLKKHE